MTSCFVTFLDGVDPRDIEVESLALLPDRFGSGFRHHADLGQGVAGVGFDLEPDA